MTQRVSTWRPLAPQANFLRYHRAYKVYICGTVAQGFNTACFSTLFLFFSREDIRLGARRNLIVWRHRLSTMHVPNTSSPTPQIVALLVLDLTSPTPHHQRSPVHCTFAEPMWSIYVVTQRVSSWQPLAPHARVLLLS